MTRGTQLEIRPQALRHNAALARKLAPDSSVYAMVKANAYGHGLALAVNAMAPVVDGFGVAFVEEAQELLAIKPDVRVMVLEGCFDEEEWLLASELGLTVVLRSTAQLAQLNVLKLPRSLALWVKVDTGMHRLGMPVGEVDAAISALKHNPYIELKGLMSHLACADEPQHPLTARQLALISAAAQSFGLPYSVANSAALIRYPEHHNTLVRPGIMLYGASPLAEQSAAALGIAVTQQLTAPIIAFTQVPKGESVGYGASWVAERDTCVAVVALGYGDGYPRHAPSHTPVAINGQRTTLAGRVSMDMLTVDVTDMPHVMIGDRVEFWGDTVSATEVAEACGTISYELFCQVTSRPRRVIRDK